jgi:two-component system response regulator CpxR
MILIVDDDPLVQRTCQVCLEPLGYAVGFARYGAEALEIMATARVSAVLVDIFMPEMDGIETLLAIRKKKLDIPIIVMSGGGARGRFDFLAAAMKFGASEMLKKPFSARDLAAVVAKCRYA